MEERYEIKGKIGQGGLGAVYRAYDERMNREVAIKRILANPGDSSMSEEATRQLIKEAGSLASLQHPNIVTIYDVGRDDDGPFVVMELLTGDTLEELIAKGSFTWPDFRQLAMQTLEALIAAQELHLVHRDLKPSNIMLSWLPSGKFQVKIVDFGLAKLSSAPSLQTIDQSDGVFGSIYFMAPEQFERVPIDLKADLYAIGCVFYYALTGTYPYDGDSAVEVMASHLQHHVTPLQEIRSGIPVWACEWIMWHINRQPPDRPESAREALKYFVENDEHPSPALSTGMPAPIAEEPKRPRLVIPGAAPTPEIAKEPVPTQPMKTAAAPIPLKPPAGSKPSVHTTAQVLQSAPPEETPPPPPAPTTPPPPPVVEADSGDPPVPVLAKAATAPENAPVVLRKATPGTTANATVVKAEGAATQPLSPSIATDRPPARPPGPSTVALTPNSSAAPAETPAGPATSVTPQVAQKKKGLSPAIKMVIAILLGLLAVGLAIAFLNKSRENAEAKEYNEMIQIAAKDDATEVPVNKRRLEILLRSASSVASNKDRYAVYKALFLAKATDGTDVDARIAEFATTQEIIPDVRVVIIRDVLRKRKNPAIIGTLLDFARTTDKRDAAIAAIEATRFMSTDAQFREFLDIIKETKDDMIRKAAEENAAEIIKKTDSKPALGKAIAEAHEAATDEVIRHSMLRLLGRIGGDASLALARKSLNSESAQDKIAAIVALGTWADDSGFEELIEYLGTGPDLQLRARAYDSAYQYASVKEGDTEETWTLLSTEAKTQDEQMKLIRGLANVKPEPWAFALLQKLADGSEYDKVIDLAERAIVRLKDIQKTQAPTKKDD
jgi:serine/threonine protein kinase